MSEIKIKKKIIFKKKTSIVKKDSPSYDDLCSIIDKNQWLYPDVPKIAHIYIQELNFQNFQNIKNFYDLNPDWMPPHPASPLSNHHRRPF